MIRRLLTAAAAGVTIMAAPVPSAADVAHSGWKWLDAFLDCPADCDSQEYDCPCYESPPPDDPKPA